MIGIYIRVSSREQVEEGYSLQTQKERLKAFCKINGWTDYKYYVEEGRSAKNDKRPVYQDMMKAVKNGKLKTILVYRLDRIMRSIRELDDMLRAFEKHGCSFKSATEPFDTTNATGKLFIYLVGALAQWENELKSERISEVLEEKVAKEGVWIGNIPYPFDKDEDTQKLISNERRTRITLEMIDMIKKGKSSLAVADYLNETNNDRYWRANTVLRILKNPALCGHTSWNDNLYKNTHKGIISEKEFEHIQDILNDRKIVSTRKTKSIAIFQGKVICPSCDHILTVNRYYRKRKDGTEIEGAVYKCNECARHKRFNKCPSEVNLLDALYTYMRDVKIEKIGDIKIEDETPKIIRELEKMENKRGKYQRAWANDLMTDEEFQKRMDETREEYEQLKEQITNIDIPKPIDKKAIENIVLTFNDNFRQLTKKEKREFVSMFIKSIEFKLVSQPPKRPDKSKFGRDKAVIENIVFY